MMRLLFIHPFLFRYARGIERFTFCLANALVEQGVQVDLLTWRWPHTVQVAELDPRVGVHMIPTSRYYAARFAVPFYLQHLLTHSYDFIWTYFAGYGEAESITLASLVRPLRFGITFHYPYSQARQRYREFERFHFINRAQRIIAISSFVEQGIRQSLGRESIVVRSAADTDHFQHTPDMKNDHRAALGLRPDDQVVLTVAALEERKGIQHMINALPEVIPAHPQLKYLVLGEGPFRSTLESLIHDQGLDGFVLLPGAVSNIFPYYNSADVFALLSEGEGLPAAPIEAMAMELPLLTSAQPPFDELMDASYGICVEAADRTQVAAALDRLLEDPARRRKMGQAARARVVTEFTYKHMAAQYIELCSRPATSSLAVAEEART